jgi:hypothetical protein
MNHKLQNVSGERKLADKVAQQETERDNNEGN